MTSPVSYRKNYFRIYVWQTLSILLGVISLFIVIPFLSTDKILYGIYSVCTSLTIFFSYADLGFVSAGVKYAAEYFIRGEIYKEMKVIGFTAFIMILVFILVSFLIIFLAVYPKLLIPDLNENSESFNTARYLLITLAVSCPIIICQRLLNIVFTIRVEDYLFQRMMIVGNFFKISSVLFFFGGGRYLVVEYYIFLQTVNLIVVAFALLYTRKYGYSISYFLKSIKWDSKVFNKVKKISGTSLVMTACMILYYELDQIAISHWLGIEAVAIYGMALSVMSIMRSFNSIVFSPYTSRYNHFVGLHDFRGLTSFVNKMISIFGVILVVPIVTVSLFASPFVVSWVGNQYLESSILISIMVLSLFTNFIKDPIGSYFIATERNMILLKSSCLLPVLFWLGICLTINWLGLLSFAIFKFIAPTVVAIYYWKLAKKDFKSRGFSFISIKKAFLPLICPILFLAIMAYFIVPHMFYYHSKLDLLLNVLIMGVSAFMAVVIGILSNRTMKEVVIYYFNSINSRIKK